jgi:glycosyltransferase involved in cell wall biosynthesis
MARICIDGFNLSMAEGSGIATYARNLHAVLGDLGHETQILYSASRKLGPENLLNQIALFDSPTRTRFSAMMASAMRTVPPLRPVAREVRMTGEVITADMAPHFPKADRVWASRDVFHSANRAHRAWRRLTPLRLGPEVATDLMHWTCLLPLIEPRIANVYTLHDLIPLRLPYTTLDDKRAYFDLCAQVAARADRIFTVSEHSRRDIVELLGVDEAKVVNTYQAVSLPPVIQGRTDQQVADELEGVFGLTPGGYFLFLGGIDPKKNPKRLLEAYAASLAKAPLVIVGAGWLGSRLASWASDETFEGQTAPADDKARGRRIRRYDFVPFAPLMSLVRGARGVLFPSLYEGFGLPVLEAMLLGAPVLTSTEGALPEVAGDAALLVDPYDVDAIRDGIRALDRDADLRAHLVERGRVRAEAFSPERYRERLSDAYAPLL